MYRPRAMLVLQMTLVILAGLSQLTIGLQMPLIFAGMVPLNLGDRLPGHVGKDHHRATPMPTTAVCELLCEHHLGGTACNCNKPDGMTTPITPMPTTDVCELLCEYHLGGTACNCTKPKRHHENPTTTATAVTMTTQTKATTTETHGNRFLDDLSQFLSGNIDNPGSDHHEGTTRPITTPTRPMPTTVDVCEVLCEQQVGGNACNCNKPGVPG